MEILLLLGLILLNGAFAMTEIALVTARKGRLQSMVDAGDRRAAVALALNEHPTRVLSTIQVGITSIGILSGIVGEAAFAAPLSQWLVERGMAANVAAITATAAVVAIVTYFAIVLGELVPKRIGQLSPETIARRVATPIRLLALLAAPFVRLLASSTDLILRLLRARDTGAAAFTEEEIQALVREGSASGVLHAHEHAIVRNVFRLDDRQIGSLMTPRSDIVYLDLEDAPADNLRKAAASEHARYPVCRGGLHDVIGVLSTRRLFQQWVQSQRIDLQAAVEPATFVPESLNGMELLESFRAAPAHMAIVVDEYGEIQGIVTPQDLFEAIAGEFKSPSAEAAWAVQRADGSWLLDGLIPVPELKDRLALATVPEEELGRYNTLAGMLMLQLGRVPRTGDVAQWEQWRFEIVDMDGNRIDKVLATPAPAPEVSALGD